jgi:DNA-binding transcriptional LysR family regulator
MQRPKLKLDNLIAFLTLAETGDFNRAAEELGLTVSALRKQMDTIQDAVGSRLFQRTKDGQVLTEGGVSAGVKIDHIAPRKRRVVAV